MSGAVVAELFADALPVYVGEAVLLTASWFVRLVCASSASNACFTLLIASLIVATNLAIFSQRGRSPPHLKVAMYTKA